MTHNFYALVRSRFPADRQRPLLTDDRGRRLSYAEAEAAVARMLGALVRAGLKPGDRVAVQVDKSPDLLILYLACLAGRFVFQPINPAYRETELSHLLADAEPALVVCPPEKAEWVATLARGAQVLTLGAEGDGSLLEAAVDAPAIRGVCDRAPDDLAALLYSSGTTGKPKGAMLTHANLASNGETLMRAWGFTGSDTLLHALPLFHAHGLFVGVSCVLLSGAAMRFLPRF
ncbi:MAG: AMP-binding protein, partial [Rhodospirillales bacterium]|nr:AMP-binding protein [Rhodospirillales bacterium]